MTEMKAEVEGGEAESAAEAVIGETEVRIADVNEAGLGIARGSGREVLAVGDPETVTLEEVLLAARAQGGEARAHARRPQAQKKRAQAPKVLEGRSTILRANLWDMKMSQRKKKRSVSKKWLLELRPCKRRGT